MPRVTFVKSARKENPVAKVGEPYYWWKFRYGGKRYSLTAPRRSQLTQSAHYGAIYDIEDEIGNFSPDRELEEQTKECADLALDTAKESAQELIDGLKDQLAELGETAQESLDNMPEALQEAPTGELLQSRIDGCENAVNELDCIDFDDIEVGEVEEDGDLSDLFDTAMDEVESRVQEIDISEAMGDG
jgi:hypothetical protein|tara:strand:+ start:1103 stop:1666 length:564 start_codon:yes stop_codon:yes gene_type:complete